MPKKLAILFAYFLIYVVWGSTYYFIGVALHGFPTFLLGALRFSTAGLILLVICACRGERVFIPRLVGILTEIAGMSFFSMNHQHGTADFADIGEQRHIDE